MNTQTVKITDAIAQSRDIENAASVIKSGGIVVIPTETVYGVGGDATNSTSSRKIYAAKYEQNNENIGVKGIVYAVYKVSEHNFSIF